MSPKKTVSCPICKTQESKYTCPTCYIVYCSVECFKEHKENVCSVNTPTRAVSPVTTKTPDTVGLEALPSWQAQDDLDEHIPDKVPSKPLTSLRWPYLPDASSYDDPLKRDDPKPLKLRDYEAIASSPAIRKILTSRPNLCSLLQRVDKLRGREREDALERLLGVSEVAISGSTETEDDIKSMKQLAEAIEKCVRGDKAGALGLDWNEHT